MWLLAVCVSSHGALGWSVVYDSDHNHFWDVCGDTELTKVAPGMRSDLPPLCQIIKKPAQGLNSIQKPHQM